MLARQKNFGTGSVNVAAALYSFATRYCAPGGGVSQYGTGPYCQDSCSNCPCQNTSQNSQIWCGYPYQCVGYDWSLTNITYQSGTSKPGIPFIFTEYFDNYLNISQNSQFSRSESTSNTYSWTFSQTVEDSMSVSVTVPIPDICEIHDSFSASISMTTTDTQTKSDSKNWSVSESITIPPRSTIKVQMEVNTQTYQIPYTADLVFSGYGMTWCKNKVNGHWCWFIPPISFLNTTGCVPYGNPDQGDAVCSFAGTFYGTQGVQVFVNVTRCPLGDHC